MNINKLLALTVYCLSQIVLFGQGYEIKVSIKGYTHDTLLLGYHYGDKEYIKDTAFRKNNDFVFKADTLLEPGMYLIVTEPDHNFLQILIDKDKTKFSVETQLGDMIKFAKFKNSKLNTEFLNYINFVSAKREMADSLSKIMQASKDSVLKKKLENDLINLDKDVKMHQENVIKEQGKSILALLINTTKEIEIPEFTGNKDEKNDKVYKYYKAHYFDYFDFKDNRLIRLPFFQSKIDKYFSNLVMQHPDSINAELDFILDRCDEKSEIFKYLLSTQLTNFANSKFVGMDGVYVHLVDKYYASGKTPWVDEESLAKIIRDAKALKPLLIDKIAPDFYIYKKDSTLINLHSVKAEYTILVIWAPDCGHCKKSMPLIVDFYNKYKSKGVEIFAVCNKSGPDEKKCWDNSEIKLGDWINTSDPNGLSNYRYLYDVKTTPQVYILDKNKKILTKKISAEQLPEVMEKLFKIKENESN
ncbi:MAG: redoxin family protein [Saprospiraceae bacterium]